MPNMRSIIAIIALVSLVLLFGCTAKSVPQGQYDTLAASCSKAQADAASSLASEVAKTGAANEKLSTCTQEKQSLESLVAVREGENAQLRAENAVLDAARAKTSLAAQYNATIGYYLEAFGPGHVPNTVRLKNIDTQVASMNDSALQTLWLGVKNCQGISDCDNAKATFISYIDGRITALNLEAAAIVGNGQ